MNLLRALLFVCLAAFGQEQAPKPTPTPEVPLTEIPKDAKRLEPELYKWVDAQGKAWLLRRTPFGIIRTPEAVDAQYRKLIPKDAVRVGPNTFKWTDPQGKKWMYEITPLGGISKAEQTEEDKPDEPEVAPSDWTVQEDGDMLKFTRPWPFGGLMRWSRQKDDLSDTEKAVWELELKKRAEQKKKEKK
jgi:hypothetical protein